MFGRRHVVQADGRSWFRDREVTGLSVPARARMGADVPDAAGFRGLSMGRNLELARAVGRDHANPDRADRGNPGSDQPE